MKTFCLCFRVLINCLLEGMEDPEADNVVSFQYKYFIFKKNTCSTYKLIPSIQLKSFFLYLIDRL